MLRHIKNTNPIIHTLGKLEMLFVIPQLKRVTNLMCFQMIIYLILNILTQSEYNKLFINFVLFVINLSFSYTWRRVIKVLLQDGYIFKLLIVMITKRLSHSMCAYIFTPQEISCTFQDSVYLCRGQVIISFLARK